MALNALRLFAALCFTLPAPSLGNEIKDAFRALDRQSRIEVQAELARADLYLGEPNGSWSPATERALQRGVETVALHSNGMEHYRMDSAEGMSAFMAALTTGKLDHLLGATSGGLLSDSPAFR